MKNCDKIFIERMAEAILDNRTRDLFEELSKIKGRNNFAPSNVDGLIMNMTLNRFLVLNIRIFIIVYHTIVRE